MPLKAVEPPEAVRRAAAAHVHQLATPHGIFPALREVTREDLALVAPHRMYTLGLDAIADGGIDAARPAGWRFLVADRERIVASTELADDSGSAPLVNGGPYVDSTARAIDALESSAALAEGEFELRILKVPALYVVAAWLVDTRRTVVPLDPAPSFLEAGRHYSEDEFMTALQEGAGKVTAAPEGPSGG